MGFGKIAQTGHLPGYQDTRLATRMKITAVAEPDPNYREAASRMIPGVHLYDSLERLLGQDKIDFVDICTPPSFHAGIIKTCVEKSVHIICEKPFTLTVQEATETEQLLRENGQIVFVPCHQYHYSPLWRHFKHATVEWAGESKFLLQFHVYRTEADPGYQADNPQWRTDPQMSGGGILADTGVHYIYLIQWLLGNPIAVTASTHRLRHQGMAVEDTALVYFESELGVASLVLTWGADKRANSARLVNARGSLNYDGQQLLKSSSSGTETLEVPDAADKSQYVQMYVSQFEDFVNRIEGKIVDTDWIEEAYHSIRILDACYRSASSGRTISLRAEPVTVKA